MSLRTTNLNLIPILQALLREGNVSRAATSLGLSQPATSAALARLRSLMGDPLLVQVGRSMRLTPRAREIIPPLEQLCSAMESLLQDNAFDPARAERTFAISAPDYIAFLLGEGLLETLRTTAPGIRLRFVDISYSLPEWLASGDADVAVCANVGIWPDLIAQGGYPDRMVPVVSKGHPLLSKSNPTAADTGQYPQLTFGAGLDRARPGPPPSATLPGLRADARIKTEQFIVLPLLAARSDCVALVPKSLAERFAAILPIHIIDSAAVDDIDTTIFWGPVQDADPGHRWLRGVLAKCLEEKLGPARSH